MTDIFRRDCIWQPKLRLPSDLARQHLGGGALRLRRWIELSRSVAAKRLFVDGIFVTAKPDPNDVDAVVWLGADFVDRVSRGDMEAMELEMMLVTRQPEEIFAAEDRRDWDDWVRFFSQTREADGRRKGIVEVEL